MCNYDTTESNIYFIFFFFLTFCGHKTSSDVKDGIGSFSYKNGHIAFTYFKNNVASIYYTTHIDSIAKQLTFPKTGWGLTFDLSRDLSKILYVNYPKGNYEISNICLFDLTLEKTDTLLKGGQIITNVCISNDNKFVYYLDASEIKNYSPIANKAPHGIDLYELNIETKKTRRITNLKAYNIQGLKTTPIDTILSASMFDDEKGLIMISTNTGQLRSLDFDSPRNPVKQLFTPIDIRLDSIIYEAPYELYKHNLKSNKSEFILRCPDGYQFGVVQPDETWRNILFSAGDKIYFYNLPNEKLTEIKLKIK
jgi:hypothetical protein